MKYLRRFFLGIFLATLLSSGVVFAHGGADEHATMRHPETQIGLPGSVVGQDGASDTTSGMTREEVAALIEDIQAPEETRSLIKLALLTIAILGLVALYYPRKRTALSVATSVADPSPTLPETSTDTRPEGNLGRVS